MPKSTSPSPGSPARRPANDLRARELEKEVRQLKQQLRAAVAGEERFRQFAENSADVLWIVDPATGELDYVSPAYERIWGEPRAAIMRDLAHWRELVHPDDRERVAGQLPGLRRGESFAQDYRINRPGDGEMRWIHDTGFPVRDEKGAITRLAGIARDVTAEKTHLEALATSEERYRLLVDGARDYAIFMLDPGGYIIYWSAGAERVFGWTAEEALGLSGEIVFTPEDRAVRREEKEMAIALKNGVADDRRWHLRKDGSRIWADGVMRRLDDEQGHPRAFAKIVRDATAERLAADALEKSRQELEFRVLERTAELTSANQALEKEIRQRSELEQEILLISEREKRRIGQDLHDSLCQELAATAFLLESNAQRLAKTNRTQAKAFSEAAQRVNDNVGLARDLARGMHPVELTSGGLADALRELAYSASNPKISCHFVSRKTVRVADEGVALSLYRIAQEALTNALKHGQPTTITITLECARKNLTLRIHDDGDGFRLDDSTGGLGIHIMKYRAQSAGGTLEIKSKKREGATITCTVPVATCNPPPPKKGK